MISGKTTLIAHLGYPTESFRAPMIYNPYFEKHGIDAVVMPMCVRAEDYPDVFRSLFRLTNIRGALITMPHKITTISPGRGEHNGEGRWIIQCRVAAFRRL